MLVEPISWIVYQYKDVNHSQLIINAHLDKDNVLYGYSAMLSREWPLGDCYLAFNDEDYFWFSENTDRELTPHLFKDLQEAAKIAYNTK